MNERLPRFARMPCIPMRMSNALHGFLLALTTALFRDALPIALKQITGRIEPLAIVWLRFVVVSAPLAPLPRQP